MFNPVTLYLWSASPVSLFHCLLAEFSLDRLQLLRQRRNLRLAHLAYNQVYIRVST